VWQWTRWVHHQSILTLGLAGRTFADLHDGGAGLVLAHIARWPATAVPDALQDAVLDALTAARRIALQDRDWRCIMNI